MIDVVRDRSGLEVVLEARLKESESRLEEFELWLARERKANK